MNTQQFMKSAKEKVWAWLVVAYSKKGKEFNFAPADVFVIWQCKTLQNHKAILAVPGPDMYLFEVTYNGDKDELYLDVYDKVDHRCICRKGA